MRRLLAGLILLALSFPAIAFADLKGEVESIGFGSLYRPNCWVPMLVRVAAEKSGTYQIRVIQEDLDRDHEIFREDISLTGSEDGKAEQRFWMYFIPQPTDGGLPDQSNGGTLRDLQQQLKVILCDEKGRQLIQLPITQTILNIEKVQAGPFTSPKGVKLILAVSDGAAQPIWRDYQQAIGTMEDTVFVTVRSVDLPEDVRGYEMVDAVVYLGATVPDPAKASDEKRFRALQNYVRGGGHLVVCQPAQRDTTAPLADLLPVEVKEIAPRTDLEPLKTLATEKYQQQLRAAQSDQIDTGFNGEGQRRRREDWSLVQGPFMFARAEPKPGAVVEMKLNWGGGEETPYLARIGYGLGCVTWVAHDLSDPAITSHAKSGWPWVWDKVLNFHNDLIIVDNQTSEPQKRPYWGAPAYMDVGHALLEGMDLASKSRVLVSIAVVFFIAYWVVAGPGVYFYLLTKSRPQLSWFLFAFSAVVATVLTVLVVKLVVRGAPELHHVTVVRGTANEPNEIISRFGLYIPRDGAQEIALPEVAPKNVSYLVAYPQHPQQQQSDVEFPAQIPYVVPIHDANEEGPVEISVPYRSTLKKFYARRIGQAGGTIAGRGRLRMTEGGRNLIEGLVTNATEKRLRNVYFAYYDDAEGVKDDAIFYLPTWEKGQTLDLNELNDNTMKFIRDATDKSESNLAATPEQKFRLRGVLGKPGSDIGWSSYWFSKLRVTGYAPSSTVDDLGHDIKISFPLLSLFGHLPAVKNQANGQQDRVEVLRRGARDFDISAAVTAGKMVVLAEAEGDQPLPFPLKVEGQKVEGKGTTFYQFVLPMDHIAQATTQPTGQPATTQSATTQPVASVSGSEVSPWRP